MASLHPQHSSSSSSIIQPSADPTPRCHPLPSSEARYGANDTENEEEEALPHCSRVVKPLSAADHLTAYWDAFPKIWLTRASLKELDRRAAETFLTAAARPAGNPHLENIGITKSSPELKRFSRQGGPNLDDLRGGPEHIYPRSMLDPMSLSSPPVSLNPPQPETRLKRSTAYDRHFEQHLVDHAVYPPLHQHIGDLECSLPNNEQAIRERLSNRRASVSASTFDAQKFANFVRMDVRATDEASVAGIMETIILGDFDAKCRPCKNRPFKNLDSLTTPAAVILAVATPDMYYGVLPAEIDPRIRRKLGTLIVPVHGAQVQALPNFLIELKGMNSVPKVAERQVVYDGALSARGIHALRAYGLDDPDGDSQALWDHEAYVLTATYQSTVLRIFATHVTRPVTPGGLPKYHTTLLKGVYMGDTPEGFRHGVCALRNARDWAKEQRDAVVAMANARARMLDALPTNVMHSSSIVAPSVKEDNASESQPQAFVDDATLDTVNSPRKS